jgi:pimeloyl-ACP methyl ester carboxylesterase
LLSIATDGLDSRMENVEFDGIRIEYELTGGAEPVVLPHARPFAGWYGPLAQALDRTVLRYRRSAPRDRPFGLEEDAALCARLLDRLGIEHPDVVGHSYGGLIALELARSRHGVDPRSVALLEPATIGLLPPDEAASRLGVLLEEASSDGPEAAMRTFLRVVCGEDGAAQLDKLVPGAVDEAIAHADGFFAVEFPAAIRWTFVPDDVRADLPILLVRGTASAPRSAEAAEIVRSWFPGSELRVLAGASHLLVAEEPGLIARRIAEFWSGSA